MHAFVMRRPTWRPGDLVSREITPKICNREKERERGNRVALPCVKRALGAVRSSRSHRTGVEFSFSPSPGPDRCQFNDHQLPVWEMTWEVSDPNADGPRTFVFQRGGLHGLADLGFGRHGGEATLGTAADDAPNQAVSCLRRLETLRCAAPPVAEVSYAQAQKPYYDDSGYRWRHRVLVEMRPNDLWHVLFVLASMPMTTIGARTTVMCIVELMWAVELLGAGPGPSAFWESWCVPCQTRKRLHVDGTDW